MTSPNLGANNIRPWSLATANIVAAGTPCMLAGGNDGFFGLYYASAASAGKDVTSVGSVDNINTPTITAAGYYNVDGASTKFPLTLLPFSASTFDGFTLPIFVDTFDTTTPDDGCNGFTANLTNTIPLIRGGTCDFDTKAQAAAAAGAKYIMFYDNWEGQVAAVFTSDILGSLYSGSYYYERSLIG